MRGIYDWLGVYTALGSFPYLEHPFQCFGALKVTVIVETVAVAEAFAVEGLAAVKTVTACGRYHLHLQVLGMGPVKLGYWNGEGLFG